MRVSDHAGLAAVYGQLSIQSLRLTLCLPVYWCVAVRSEFENTAKEYNYVPALFDESAVAAIGGYAQVGRPGVWWPGRASDSWCNFVEGLLPHPRV